MTRPQSENNIRNLNKPQVSPSTPQPPNPSARKPTSLTKGHRS